MTGRGVFALPFAGGRSSAFTFLGVSLAFHAALLGAILAVRPPADRRATPVSVEIVETRRPAPEPKPEPREEPPRVLRPAPRVVRAPRPPVPDDAPPPPPVPDDAPPPPNAPPDPGARAGPVRLGISMSSTTTAGEYAAPTGNTLYGKAAGKGEDPEEGKPRLAGRYALPTQVTSLPEPLGCDIPKSEYPEEARRLGIEGEVALRLVVDEEGHVRDVKVMRDPGHGFGSVAQRSAKVYCRFRPAKKDGEAVATEIPYTIRFEL